MYGPKSFSITISGLQQCVRSTKLVTATHLPRLFVLDFIRRFGLPRQTAWFFRAMRATSLVSLVVKEQRDAAIVALRSNMENTEKRARSLQAEANEKIAQLDRWEKSGNDADLWPDPFGPNPDGQRKVNAKSGNPQAFQKLKQWNQGMVLEGVKLEKDCLDRTDTSDDDTNVTYSDAPWTMNKIVQVFEQWHRQVLENPTWWGFSSDLQVKATFAKSPVELSTEMCISQRGYFMTGGKDGNHNQICERSAQPVVFLCSPGLDFCFPLPTRKEAEKYFVRDPEKARPAPGQDPVAHLGWVRWLDHGKESFHKRVKALYRTIFTSARLQGVRNPSMLPLGLGVFLGQLEKPHSQHIVAWIRQHYFRVQFELLSEEDWGFENYFLNAQQFKPMAIEVLNEQIATGKDYNSPQDGLFFRCNIVFHDRDAKFLAHQLALDEKAPAFLNPSDSQAVLHGALGMYWEMGRGINYVGEEDWAATSTGALGSFMISRTAIGMDDVVFQLQSGQMLHVSKVCGDTGLLCTVATSDMVNSSTIVSQDGPFDALHSVERGGRRLTFGDQRTGKKQYDLAAITKEPLQALLGRVRGLQECHKHERPPFHPCPGKPHVSALSRQTTSVMSGGLGDRQMTHHSGPSRAGDGSLRVQSTDSHSMPSRMQSGTSRFLPDAGQ